MPIVLVPGRLWFGAFVAAAVAHSAGCAATSPAEQPSAQAVVVPPVELAAPLKSTATPASSPPPPTPAPPAPPAPPRVVIAASGDVVLNPRAVASARAFEAEGGFRRMIAGYAQVLDEQEVVFANLETPLVDDVLPLSPGWPPVLGCPAGLGEALSEAGVDVVSVANNHAYDQSHVGLRRTLDLLDRLGVAHAGAGGDLEAAYGPAVVERGGVRIAFLSFTNSMNRLAKRRGHEPVHVARLWNEERSLAAVRAARDQADLVVLSLHWSTDFVMAPDPSQRRLARQLVEAGADLVIGHGPHVLQPVERLPSDRGEALVAYSLGNLVSGMGQHYRLGHPPHGYVHPANVRPEARDGLVLRVTVEVDGGTISMLSVEGTPLWTLNNFIEHRASGVRHDVHVVPLRETPPPVRAERLPVVRAALGSVVTVDD